MGMFCSNCNAKNSGGMTDHKCGLFCGGIFSQHNEIAFILAIVIIYDDDHLAAAETFESVEKVIFHQ